MEIPVIFDNPWWNTSQGLSPKFEFTAKTVPLEQNINPIISLHTVFNILIINPPNN